MNIDDFHRKCEGSTLEAGIYKTVRSLLSDYNNQVEIRKEFPKQSIERRNTGYAVDVMLEMAPFTAGGPDLISAVLSPVPRVHLPSLPK